MSIRRHCLILGSVPIACVPRWRINLCISEDIRQVRGVAVGAFFVRVSCDGLPIAGYFSHG